MPLRDYIFYDFTISLCHVCFRRIDAKILIRDSGVYMEKRCPEHGKMSSLIASDAEYYIKSRQSLKPGDMPKRFNTSTHYGCPYDCGLCPDHEQHSCLTLIEVTDRCNLSCPVCYSESSPQAGRHRTLDEIAFMLDAVTANEGRPDIVQISGGEPTVHPDFFQILDLAKARPIRHIMLNTNGIRIAREEGFAEKLAGYMPGFEIYLQFDSLRSEALRTMRGADLTETRREALRKLNALNLSTTLVVTLQKGINDQEIGEILRFAVQQPCVRGVTFQPVQTAGRLESFAPENDRLTLTEVRSEILRQSNIFMPEDIIPVPCNPDCLAMAYALRSDDAEGSSQKITPLSSFINPEKLLEKAGNTIVFEQDENIRGALWKVFSTSEGAESAGAKLATMLCCLPGISAPQLSYQNVFRIIIMQFLDAHNFDLRAVKKSCVHIARPDGTIIPFDTMNLFYRDEKQNLLQSLRSRPVEPVRSSVHG